MQDEITVQIRVTSYKDLMTVDIRGRRRRLRNHSLHHALIQNVKRNIGPKLSTLTKACGSGSTWPETAEITD